MIAAGVNQKLSGTGGQIQEKDGPAAAADRKAGRKTMGACIRDEYYRLLKE